MVDTDLSGTVLDGRYQVIEPIAEGAMGAVYRGERLKLGRAVAIKIMHHELPDELASRQRFEREAKLMALLEHPNCVSVIDFGVHDDKPFLVMDLVRGTSLLELLDKQGHLDIARSADIIRQVLSGLAHAHELGIVHRDIKPANIMISEKAGLGSQVRILDFGLARLQEATGTKLTTGIVVGTPNYMAPEQCKGGDIDARTDLYACGVMLFEMLTGRKPFVANDPIQVVRKHLTERPPTLASAMADVDFGDFEAVIAKALSKAPADRFESAVAMAKAVEAAATRATKMSAAALFSRAVPETAPPIGNQQATMSGWNVPAESGGAQPGTGNPAMAHSPVSNAPMSSPPMSNPPMSNPPMSNPPMSNPPVSNPPVSNPPISNPAAKGGYAEQPSAPHASVPAPPGTQMLSDSAILPDSVSMSGGAIPPHDATTIDPRYAAPPHDATTIDPRYATPPHDATTIDPGPFSGEATVRDSAPPGSSMPPLPKAAPYAPPPSFSTGPSPAAPSRTTGPAPQVSSTTTGPAAQAPSTTTGPAAQVPSSGAPDRSLGIPPTRPTTSPAGPTSDRPIRQLPLTKKQLMIAGGGLVGLIVIIALVAGGGSNKKSGTPKTGGGASGTTEEPAADPVPQVIERANAQIASEDYEDAVATLKRARKANPDNAELAFLSGKANFARLWWSDGIDDFRDAIRIDDGYKENPELLKIVLRGFLTTPDIDDRIVDFMREIGPPMRPYLEETAEKHPKKALRARARAELNARP